MAKNEKTETPENRDNPQELSLSAALLAPVNSIFEAQIHAARAFLNFILQMGFRHKYSREEKAELESRMKTLDKNHESFPEVKETLEMIRKQEEADEKVKPLLEKARMTPAQLTEDEKRQIQDYMRQHGDLFLQCIPYLDPFGKLHKIYIPNLALLPIKPLTIESAKFNYEMYVSDASQTFDQMGAVKGLSEKERPWYLINPKSVRGTITSSEVGESSKTIKIEMSIKSGDIPYGLHQLLAALTNIAQDSANTNSPLNQ